MTKHLLRYGLGRPLSFIDQQAVDAIVEASEKDGYKLKGLIVSIITHPIFFENVRRGVMTKKKSNLDRRASAKRDWRCMHAAFYGSHV